MTRSYRAWSSQGASVWSLWAANVLILVAIWQFAFAFFPYKPVLSGRRTFDQGQVARIAAAPPPFNKIVFMVVDALRSDFVYSPDSGFHFLHDLISDGACLPFTARASPPTVTMPKIKALTTGSIPSFLDAILNVAEADTTSTLAAQDSWPLQLRALPRGRLVFYGDDTWLKLFPQFFDRADGTTSFFVADFTEVDNNVTRHVQPELEESDWNGMILHYLGLDHIGHKSGPQSVHMRPKQTEMDGIVREIYHGIETKPHLESTLLVLCGDHGMNEVGNHGGSSIGEVSSALAFISPKLRQLPRSSMISDPQGNEYTFYDVVDQGDLVPTLAALLGFPTPKNNLGIFIPKLLDLWSHTAARFAVLEDNARQIASMYAATFGDEAAHGRDAITSCTFRELQDTDRAADRDSLDRSDDCLNALREASRHLARASTRYSFLGLFCGLLAASLSLLSALYAAVGAGMDIVQVCAFLVLLAAHGAMMLASSFVEEEQVFWYWSASLFIVVLAALGNFGGSDSKQRLLTWTGILLSMRLLRRWNQTGQKHAGSPDIASVFSSGQGNVLLLLATATYLVNYKSLAKALKGGLPDLAGNLVALVVSTAAWTFKMAFTLADRPTLFENVPRVLVGFLSGAPVTALAQIVAISTLSAFATAFLITFMRRSDRFSRSAATSLQPTIELFLLNQTRLENIPVFLLFQIQAHLIRNARIKTTGLAWALIFFEHTSFFAFGGSNAISSIDLSNAYNGLVAFAAPAVGALAFISNWAGPIWWTCSLIDILAQSNKTAHRATTWMQFASLLTCFTAGALVNVMIACIIFRSHLFIWTVFSPKFLFSMAWSLGQHLLVHCLVGGIIYYIQAWQISSTARASAVGRKPSSP